MVDRGKRSWKIPHTEHAPLGETQRKTIWLLRWVKPEASLSSEQGVVESDAHWQEVCHDTKLGGKRITKKAFFEAMCESFGQIGLFATTSLQKNVRMRSAMEHTYPEDVVAESLVVDTPHFDLFKKRQMGNGEFDTLTVGKDPSSNGVRFLRICFVSGRKLHVKALRTF